MRLGRLVRLPRRAPRAAGAAVWLLLLSGLAVVPAAATAVTRPQARAARDPASNRSLSSATLWSCQVNPAGAPCVNSVLQAIDRARAADGVRALRLPSGFAALSQPQQLLVLADLERSDRGLVPAIGLSRGLDLNALAAARANQDPIPSPFYGNTYGSNWAGGIGSTLAVDFLWMYDDGPGSFNIDCRSAQASGCWGHRHNILYPYQAPVAMGAAVAGTSMTEVFVGGDGRTRPGQADAPLAIRAARR